jgi:hypothetical protein
MGVLFVLVGVALAVVYAVWRAGAFPGAVRHLAETTSPALIGAMPVFAAGFVAFGASSAWQAGLVVGFLLLAADIGVLAALVHGFLGFLVPPAARIDGGAHVIETADPEDPRPVLETFFTAAETFAFGRGAVTGSEPRSGVEARTPPPSRAAG